MGYFFGEQRIADDFYRRIAEGLPRSGKIQVHPRITIKKARKGSVSLHFDFVDAAGNCIKEQDIEMEEGSQVEIEDCLKEIGYSIG